MYKFISVLFIFFFSFSGLIASENTKPMSCNHKVAMSADLLTKVLKHRDSAFNTCLTCNKGDCTMKAWNEENKNNEMICKRMFCTPIKVAKAYEVPGNSPTGKSSFDYTYSISKKGKLTDINILKVEGEFNRKDALNYLKALTKRTRYEPLVNENKKYQITNLTSSMSVNMLWEDD